MPVGCTAITAKIMYAWMGPFSPRQSRLKLNNTSFHEIRSLADKMLSEHDRMYNGDVNLFEKMLSQVEHMIYQVKLEEVFKSKG